jgi:glycosyltransferase involved in cell wall biosynthesis
VPPRIYILILSGSFEKADSIARDRYPGCETAMISKRELREGGWRKQIRELRKLEGEAVLVFVDSIETAQEPLLLKLTMLFHGCRETVIADSRGHWQVIRRWHFWKLFPEILLSAVADACVFLAGWIALKLLQGRVKRPLKVSDKPSSLDAAFLYPFPMDRAEAGGAMSHVRGFLSGLAHRSAHSEVFSGRALPATCFPTHEYPNRRRLYVFRESSALSYNRYFSRVVEQDLAGRRPSFIYQRHGRYVVAGALLSRRLRRPLVLEYNGSEVWIAQHWDPTRFLPWLKLCEEISLTAANLIVVVSDVLKEQLIDKGIPGERVLVNPNAVDPARFRPNCGGEEIRKQFGCQPDHVVIGFIGSFSYWHGIGVLQEAIQALLREQECEQTLPELRFLLIGDGPLSEEMRGVLEPYQKRGWVVFAGQVSHDRAPAYLDSADILVSPHVPMPDGKPFFGSPTKLFEYMATGKAIIASDLDQLARVLTHEQTAWLVEPGNAAELGRAIRLLAGNPQMRRQLGQKAREAALTEHTWEQNANRLLSYFDTGGPASRTALNVSQHPDVKTWQPTESLGPR